MEEQQQRELGEQIRVTRELPVKLTDEEKSKLGTRLCVHLAEEELEQAAKRRAVQESNERLKEIRKNVLRVRGAIETGSEIRDVQCLERPGAVNGTFELVRLDTGEIVETETDVERAARDNQQELPLTRPGKACEHCGMADGTHRDEPHGYARAELDVSKEDKKKGIEKHERVLPLTAAQREGLEVDEDGTIGGDVAIEYEGKSYTLLALVDGEEDDDAPDNGAAAIDLLDDIDDDTPVPLEVAPEKKNGKGRKGKKDGAEPRVRA